jgi:hypothetical protein
MNTRNKKQNIFFIIIIMIIVIGIIMGNFINNQKNKSENKSPNPKILMKSNRDWAYNSIGDIFTFNGSASTDPDGKIVNYTWDFGDSSPLEYNKIVQHTYNESGNYSVKLKVTDNDNISVTTSYEIQIKGIPEIILFQDNNNLTIKSVKNASIDIDKIWMEYELLEFPDNEARYYEYYDVDNDGFVSKGDVIFLSRINGDCNFVIYYLKSKTTYPYKGRELSRMKINVTHPWNNKSIPDATFYFNLTNQNFHLNNKTTQQVFIYIDNVMYGHYLLDSWLYKIGLNMDIGNHTITAVSDFGISDSFTHNFTENEEIYYGFQLPI